MEIMASSNLKVFVHGVLVSFENTGVLIMGESGLGKSDCALDLVLAGHKLVADDVVAVELSGDGLFGRAPERFSALLAIRGIGIVDVRKISGCDGYQKKHKIDICVEFRDRNNRENANEIEIMGVKIPVFALTPARRRNQFALAETVRKHNGPFLTINEI